MNPNLVQADPQIFQPQPGPQSVFLQTEADIAIFGGAAGGGKTYALLLEGARLFPYEEVNGVIFRRKHSELNRPGAIWLESKKIYPALGIKPNQTLSHYYFNKNSYLKFAGIQHEEDVYSWHGVQLDFIGLDEVTDFSENQFWYIFGRLRSVSGQIKPYLRATCNPDQGWLYEFLKWWIDEKTGYPIEERAGQLRWVYRRDDIYYWFDTKESALKRIKELKLEDEHYPSSVTFIPATLNDNQILLERNPHYFANLSQQSQADRIRLLQGRWFFQPKGKLFKPAQFKHFVVPLLNPDLIIVTTDTASSTGTANDYTCFQAWARKEGKIYLLDAIHGKFTTQEQLQLLSSFILQHKAKYVSIEKAATGFHLLDQIVKTTGVLLLPMTRQKDKYTRGYEVQPYLEQGYVYVNPNLPYFSGFMGEIANFSPENKNKSQIHDDWVDPFMDAIYHLLIQKIGLNRPKIKVDSVQIAQNYVEGL